MTYWILDKPLPKASIANMKTKTSLLVASDFGPNHTGYRYSFTYQGPQQFGPTVRAAYDYIKSISRRFGPQPRPNVAHPKLRGIVFEECPSALKGWVQAMAEDSDGLLNLYLAMKELREPTRMQCLVCHS